MTEPILTEEIEYDEDPRWAYAELSIEQAYTGWPCGACGTRRDEHADQACESWCPALDITDHGFVAVFTPVTLVANGEPA